MVYDAFLRYSICFSAVMSLHSQAANAMPIGAAVNGPALWVTMSVMAFASSTCVLHTTNEVFAG